MSLKTDIYARLTASSVITSTALEVYEFTPEENAAMPFLFYGLSDPQSDCTLTGPIPLFEYSLLVEGWTLTDTQQQTLYDAVIAQLHGYAGGAIQLCKLAGGTMDNVERGSGESCYMFTQTYKVITK